MSTEKASPPRDAVLRFAGGGSATRMTPANFEAHTWRVLITVPVYDRSLVLRIELDPRYVRVLVEGWTEPVKHEYTVGSPDASVQCPTSLLTPD